MTFASSESVAEKEIFACISAIEKDPIMITHRVLMIILISLALIL